MAKNEKHTGRNFAVGTGIAAIFGFLAGILTAPQSGKETRADIALKTGEAKDEVIDQLQSAQEELEEVLVEAKARVSSLSKKAKQELEDAIEVAKDAEKKAATLVKAFRKGQADDPELNKAIKQVKQAQKNLTKYLKS